jgi:3-methyladenine DNA glycosylase AlkD
MTPESLYSDILSYCQANTDPAIVKKYSRYFKEGYDAYGLTYPLLETKVKSILAEPEIDLDFVLKTSRLLIPGTKYEEPSFALMLIKAHKKHYTRDTFTEICHWFDVGIRNWAHTDALCSEILSVFLLKKIISYQDFSDWRNGKNKFQRRAVPVSLIKLMKATGNVMEYINFIEPLMMDTEREVHQGVGWFLREAWRIQPEPVEEFLLKYRNTAPRLIFQYATEKMKPGEKERFRRVKK